MYVCVCVYIYIYIYIHTHTYEEGMATHSSILAWRIPMDRGAQQATVHGAAESDMTEQLNIYILYFSIYTIYVNIHTHTHTETFTVLGHIISIVLRFLSVTLIYKLI